MSDKCKAVRCVEYGPVENLVLEEIVIPAPLAKEVLIKTETMGVNFPDALLVQGLYQMKPPTPFTPGMEVVGRVVEVGSNVTDFEVGTRVAALCELGGYAEYVAVHAKSVMPIPDDLSGPQATALMCGYSTAWYALKQRGQLKKGETLLVTGASGLTGLAAVQLGKAAGATVIAVASTQEKRDVALENGADHAIGSDNLRDEVKQLTGGRGVDVCFEVVGGETFDQCARLMAWGGRLLVIGFAGGTIGKLPANLALVKSYSLVGVFWGQFTKVEPQEQAKNMGELVAMLEAGKISPHIGAVFDLENAVDALRHILDRKAVGKIALTCEKGTK